MNGDAARSLAAGVVLAALVVVATLMDDPSASMIEDEAVVLAAIDEFMPDSQGCTEELLPGDSSARGWKGWGGSGWETEIDGFEALVVQITCDFDSDNYWFTYELRIQYPLKTGEAAEVVNSVIRSEVTEGVLDYFNESRDRFPDLRLAGDEDRSDVMQNRGCGYPGYLAVSGVVTYDNDGLFSVFLSFGQNQPCANNTFNPLASMNFDLTEAPSESGFRMPLMLFDLSDLFLDDSDWEAKLADIAIHRWAETDSSPPDGLRETLSERFISSLDFSMSPEVLTLHSGTHTFVFPGWCCATNPDHLDIRYEELIDYLDPEGPYRHIAQGHTGMQG